MRKLRKLLRILLIILPFSLMSTAFAVSEHAGGTSYGGASGRWGDDNTNVRWDDITYIRKGDPSWVTQMRNDISNSLLSPSFSAEARQFLLMWNYTHYFGSLENQPEQVVNADSYLPLSFYFYFGFYIPSTDILLNVTQEGVESQTSVNRDLNSGYASSGSLSISDGFIDVSDYSPSSGFESAETYIFRISQIRGLAGRFSEFNTNGQSVSVTGGDAYIEGNRLYYNDNDEVTITVVFPFKTDYYFHFLSESVIPEIVAPETPELTYPTQTYYDNSTGDTVTNNYYDKEINYYNYMTNAVDVLEDKADANYFEEQTQNGFSWGLLSLPAGLTAGMLEALGEYSSECKFATQPMSLNILGGHYLHIPAMSFSFDANDYPWLLPFRYLIALSLLFVLCKQGWILLSNVINGGIGDE